MTWSKLWPAHHRLLWVLVPNVIAGMAWWYFAARLLTGHVGLPGGTLVDLVTIIVIGFITFGLWIGTVLIIGHLTNEGVVQWVCALIATLPMIVFFPAQPLSWLAFGLVIIGIGLGIQNVSADVHERMRFLPYQSLSQGLSRALILLMLAISVLYFQELQTKNNDTTTQTKIANQVVIVSERILPRVYRNYQPSMTIDIFLGSQLPTADTILTDFTIGQGSTEELQQRLDQKLTEAGAGSAAVKIRPRESMASLRTELTKQLASIQDDSLGQARSELASRLKIPLRGDETLHEALLASIDHQLTVSVNRFRGVIPPVISVVLFLALRVFSWLFMLTGTSLGWLWVKVLRTAHVIEILPTRVKGERVRWKP